MEKAKRWMVLVPVVVVMVAAAAVGEIEMPQYSVVHEESNFEVRMYRESAWISALVNDLSFEKATLLGFHRLFQYIQGANSNYSRIPMTTPVITSIVPGAGPFHSSAYYVRLYLPLKFQADPPVGLPELNLVLSSWESRCIAVRKFFGYATDDIVAEEAEKLAVSLSRTPWANATPAEGCSAYSVAQYDSPFHFIGRTNEVWVDVEKPTNSSECSELATY